MEKTKSAKQSGNNTLEPLIVPKADHQRFDELMGDLHYLGSAKPTGDFMRQVVVRNGEWVALLAWGPACYALKDRDEWIGWHSAERQKLVVQNRRYLLLHNRGTEPNLASKALASALRALPEQWEQTFGYRPLLAETFTDIERFRYEMGLPTCGKLYEAPIEPDEYRTPVAVKRNCRAIGFL